MKITKFGALLVVGGLIATVVACQKENKPKRDGAPIATAAVPQEVPVEKPKEQTTQQILEQKFENFFELFQKDVRDGVISVDKNELVRDLSVSWVLKEQCSQGRLEEGAQKIGEKFIKQFPDSEDLRRVALQMFVEYWGWEDPLKKAPKLILQGPSNHFPFTYSDLVERVYGKRPYAIAIVSQDPYSRHFPGIEVANATNVFQIETEDRIWTRNQLNLKISSEDLGACGAPANSIPGEVEIYPRIQGVKPLKEKMNQEFYGAKNVVFVDEHMDFENLLVRGLFVHSMQHLLDQELGTFEVDPTVLDKRKKVKESLQPFFADDLDKFKASKEYKASLAPDDYGLQSDVEHFLKKFWDNLDDPNEAKAHLSQYKYLKQNASPELAALYTVMGWYKSDIQSIERFVITKTFLSHSRPQFLDLYMKALMEGREPKLAEIFPSREIKKKAVKK